MRVSREQVLRVAALARLHVAAGETEALARDLGAMLEFVAQLDAVDVTAVAITPPVFPPGAPLRPDEAAETLPPDDWLPAVPWREGAFPAVPRFVEE